jgi:hypothetical protein
MLVLGTVIYEQEHTCGRQAFNQTVQHRLSFRIDPMKILEYKQQRLDLTFSKQQSLDSINS